MKVAHECSRKIIFLGSLNNLIMEIITFKMKTTSRFYPGDLVTRPGDRGNRSVCGSLGVYVLGATGVTAVESATYGCVSMRNHVFG